MTIRRTNGASQSVRHRLVQLGDDTPVRTGNTVAGRESLTPNPLLPLRHRSGRPSTVQPAARGERQATDVASVPENAGGSSHRECELDRE